MQIGESCPRTLGLFLSPCTCNGVPVNNMMCRKLDVFLDPGTYFWVAKNCIVTVAKRAFTGVATFFSFNITGYFAFHWRLTSCVTYKCFSVLCHPQPSKCLKIVSERTFSLQVLLACRFSLPCYYSKYFNTTLSEILILSSIRNKVLF